MLDNLKGIDHERAILAPNISPGIRYLLLYEAGLASQPIPDICTDPSLPAPSKESVTKEDVISYIKLKSDSTCGYEDTKRTIAAGFVSGIAASEVKQRIGWEPIYLRGFCADMDYLFATSKGIDTVIFDEVCGGSIAKYIATDSEIKNLVIANSVADDILRKVSGADNLGLIVVANCVCKNLLQYCSIYTTNVVIVDTECNKAFNDFSSEYGIVLGVNNRMMDCRAETQLIKQQKASHLSTENISKVESLCFQMHKKDGFEIAKLGQEVNQILNEGRQWL